MNLTEAKQRLIETLREENELLRRVVDQQRQIIDHHRTIDTWTGAIRRGDATLDEMSAAFELEEAGEVDAPLPKGFVRTPEGDIRRAGETDNEPDPDPPASPASVEGTFLGKLA